MKISDQGVHHAELITGVDEDRCLTLVRLNNTAVCRTLQTAHTRRSHRNYPLPRCLGGCNQLAYAVTYLHDFAVHLVLGNIIDPHWLKCSSAYVQRHETYLNALVLQLRK